MLQAHVGTEEIASKLKRVQELLAKATPQETDESFVTRSYADQLLEEISVMKKQTELAKI